MSSQFELADVQLIILRVENRSTSDSLFENHLTRLINENDFSEHIEKARIVYCADFLTEGDYFMIDDHMNSKGHRKIATELTKLILN